MADIGNKTIYSHDTIYVVTTEPKVGLSGVMHGFIRTKYFCIFEALNSFQFDTKTLGMKI